MRGAFFVLDEVGKSLTLLQSRLFLSTDGALPMSANPLPPALPYSQLNLTRNPFGELSTDERIRVACLRSEEMMDFLKQPKSCLQFLGEKGRGKTTHLLFLRRKLKAGSYVHYEEHEKTTVPDDTILILDEFQRLGRTKWRQAYRKANTLLLGTHQDYSHEIQRAGFKVKTIHVPIRLTATWLCEIAQKRIEEFRRNDGRIPHLRIQEAEALLSDYGSNLRSIFSHLYDCIQHLQTPDAFLLVPQNLPESTR